MRGILITIAAFVCIGLQYALFICKDESMCGGSETVYSNGQQDISGKSTNSQQDISGNSTNSQQDISGKSTNSQQNISGKSTNGQQDISRKSTTTIFLKEKPAIMRTETHQNQVQENTEACNTSDYRRRFPDVILIGERKCGTSAVSYFLGKLSTQIKCAADEPHFFDLPSVLKKSLTVTGLSSADLQPYLAQMPLSCPSDITYEKTPKYFRTPGVSTAIYKWSPKVKLMVSLKDPITRAVSDFHFMIRQAWFYKAEKIYFKNYTFEQLAVTNEGKVNTTFDPVATSVYDTKFDKWLEFYPLMQIHIVDADIMEKDPSTELMKIERYLGLKPECTPDKFEYHETKGFFCLKGEECMGKEKGHEHPEVKEEVIEILKRYLRPHVRRLQKQINKTLSWMPRYL